MKNFALFSLLILLSLFSSMGQAQVSKTVNAIAGTLSTTLTANEKAAVTNLTITGSLDARDFKTMRDSMPVLAAIDLSTVTVVAYTGLNGTGPWETDTYPANELPQRAFFFCKLLKSVTIPTSVTSIGEGAFFECTGLTSVIIPSSVTYIGAETFEYCTGLTSVTIPYSVTSIGQSAFSGCIGLTSVSIPSAVTSIPYQTFFNCSGLTSVTIPTSITSIGQSAFSGCSGLASVIIPSSVTYIGTGAFEYCSGLTSVTIPYSVTWFGSSAFRYCTGLDSVTIISAITEIGSSAFENCSNITSINAIAATPLELSSSIFDSVNKANCTLYVPIGSKTAYQRAVHWSDFINIVEKDFSTSKTIMLNESGTLSSVLTAAELATVTNLTITGSIDARDFKTMRDAMPVLASIDLSYATVAAYNGKGGSASTDTFSYLSNELPQYAFSYPNVFDVKKTLTNIKLPVSLTSVGSHTFTGCGGLTSVTISASVTSIGEDAFSGCCSLTSVTIPASVTSIGSRAFFGCSGLTSITIPASVASIGSEAFSDFNGLIFVDEANVNFSSADGILFNQEQTVLIQCPVSKNGSYAIPSSVTSIGSHAFSDCIGLTSVLIPSSVTSIGSYAFYYCTRLTSVTIPASVTSIGVFAFAGCSQFTSIMFPTSITTIEQGVFFNCRDLTSVTIPASVTSIEDGAFELCSNINSIYANAVTPVDLSRGKYVFYDVNKTTCTLYVPIGSKTAYQKAVYWSDFINIVEMTTGLQSIKHNDIKIKTENEKLFIENATVGDKVEIYSISGIKIKEQSIESNQTKIELHKGIYLIRIDNYSEKILIR